MYRRRRSGSLTPHLGSELQDGPHRRRADIARRLAQLAEILIIPAVVIPFTVYYFFNVRNLLPQSRYYPQGVAVLLLVIFAIIILTGLARLARTGPDAQEPEDQAAGDHEYDTTVPPVEKWTKIISGTVLTVLYVIGIGLIGFYSATALYIFLTTLALDRKGLVRPLVTTVAATAGAYVMLSFIFDVPVPRGLII